MDEANADKQKLSLAEVVNFILNSADCRFPMTHCSIESYANAILQKQIGSNYQPVGTGWIFMFLDRNQHNLQTHWSKPLDMQRVQALNPEAVKYWFDLVEELVVNTGIKKEDIYRMDKSGFLPDDQGKSKVVGVRGTKTQHKQGGADQENLTAIVTICTDRTSLHLTIIFKGQDFSWFSDNVLEAL